MTAVKLKFDVNLTVLKVKEKTVEFYSAQAFSFLGVGIITLGRFTGDNE